MTVDTCLSCPHAGAVDGELVPVSFPPRDDHQTIPCIHRGAVIREVGCQLCGTIGTQMAVHQCVIHGECTPRRWTNAAHAPRVCTACPDQTDVPADPLPLLTGPANLMLFVYPRRETRHIWQPQMEIVRAALPSFDGLKLLYVAIDDHAAQDEIDPQGWTWVETGANDPQRWELPGWLWAMNALADHPGFTVRLHAKGATRGTAEQHLDQWWRLAFEKLLDVDAVREDLQRHSITGVFRRNTFAANLGVPWHYSGSMYAFRHDQIFAGNWCPPSRSPDTHYVEAWPSLIAQREEAGCLAYDHCGDLYQAKNWRAVPTAPPLVQLSSAPVRDQRKVSEISAPVQRTAPVPVGPTILPPHQVAIVVAGRNSAQYLAEAIVSALTQTIPCEVVYADDCSFDESVSIARSFESRGLRVLPSAVHRGVCDARNRGAAATVAPCLIFFDSDDILPSDYAAQHLAAMRCNTPFVYSRLQHFGAETGEWNPPEWTEANIFAANCAHSSSMFARWAFDLAGGWQQIKTAWDWDLATRCAKFGQPVKVDAALRYRRHRESWSHHDDIHEGGRDVRRRNTLLSVIIRPQGTIDHIRRWLAAVMYAVRQTEVRRELIVSRSSAPGIESEITPYAGNFDSIRYLDSFSPERLQAEAAGNLVWMPAPHEAPRMMSLHRAVELALAGKPTPEITVRAWQ